MATAIPLRELPVFGLKRLPNPSFDYSSGAVFLIDKPHDWSSFRVVSFLRNMLDIKKIGHSGTLDPMATGLLILCTGKATKSIDLIQGQEKTYEASIRFGASTPSYDAETETDEKAETGHITLDNIRTTLESKFTGKIEQVPPMYSAIKQKGQRLYKLARQGKTVQRPARTVTIHDIQITNFKNPDLELVIRCSKGTYVRSLAHDLGIALGSLAYLTTLVRTRIGTYGLEDALTISKIRELFKK